MFYWKKDSRQQCVVLRVVVVPYLSSFLLLLRTYQHRAHARRMTAHTALPMTYSLKVRKEGDDAAPLTDSAFVRNKSLSTVTGIEMNRIKHSVRRDPSPRYLLPIQPSPSPSYKVMFNCAGPFIARKLSCTVILFRALSISAGMPK